MNPITLLRLLQNPEFLLAAALGAGLFVASLIARRGIDWFLVWTVAVGTGWAVLGYLQLPPNAPVWVVPASVLAAVAGGWGIGELRRESPSALVPAMFALTVLGVWGTTPDTERAVVMMGASTPLVLGALVRPSSARGVLWPYMACGALSWAVITDGLGRMGSIVGAFGTLGMLVIAPAIGLLAGREGPLGVRLSWALLALQVALVMATGRGPGRVYDPGVALALAMGLWVVAGVGWWVMLRILGWRY